MEPVANAKLCSVDKSFQNPEVMMSIKCNRHPWTRMYLSVLSNPFFAVTGKDGMFALTGLPPGTYTICSVHEKWGNRTRQSPSRRNKTRPVSTSATSNSCALIPMAV